MVKRLIGVVTAAIVVLSPAPAFASTDIICDSPVVPQEIKYSWRCEEDR